MPRNSWSGADGEKVKRRTVAQTAAASDTARHRDRQVIKESEGKRSMGQTTRQMARNE